MAGEIQLNSTTLATESSGAITLSNVNSATNRTNLGLGSMATQNANAVAITGGSVSGASIVPDSPFSFRNKIINGNLKSTKVINQRGASSITGATGYTFDRWYYDGSTYLYQGIEDANVENGTYAISWVGSGINAAWKVSTDSSTNNGPDATTGFTSVSNGGTFSVNEVTEFSKHLWIRFDGTLSNLDIVQVERDAVTPFEYRSYGFELSLCQRFYEVIPEIYVGFANATVNFTQVRHTMTYATQKRTTSPTVTYGTISSGFSISSLLVNSSQLIFEIAHSGTGDFRPAITTNTTISAEL